MSIKKNKERAIVLVLTIIFICLIFLYENYSNKNEIKNRLLLFNRFNELNFTLEEWNAFEEKDRDYLLTSTIERISLTERRKEFKKIKN